MLVSGLKYVAFHISGQIMRRGDTFEFDKVTNISIFAIVLYVAKHSLIIKKNTKFRNDTTTGGIEKCPF